ncbi:MAG TPA: hypothetical protein VGI54_04900, partial [Solirubrobacteraceae bacterium]
DFACSFAGHRRIELGQDGDDDSDLGHFALTGHVVAYTRAACPMGCDYSVRVRDLRDGSRVHLVNGFKRFGAPTGVVLRPTGSVAWVARGVPAEVPGGTAIPRTVWLAAAAGPRRVDAGNIDLGSLGLSGTTLSWTRDGAVQHATLN